MVSLSSVGRLVQEAAFAFIVYLVGGEVYATDFRWACDWEGWGMGWVGVGVRGFI